MDSPLWPVLTNIFADFQEGLLFGSYKPDVYFHYVDDISLVVQQCYFASNTCCFFDQTNLDILENYNNCYLLKCICNLHYKGRTNQRFRCQD